MADISKIKLPGMTDAYNVKDTTARTNAATAQSTAEAKVAKSGDTMTGALVLSGAPTENLHASTKKYVDDAIAGISGGMIFKGTLGTGGTISTLPAAAAANKGHMYKVITDGTYAGIAAKVGDLFISDGSTWVHIPSGDEPSGTVTNIATGTGLTGGPITTSGTIAIDENVVAKKGDGITGTVTPLGSNAASSVSFSGTVASASSLKTAGSAGTMAAIDVSKFNGGTPTAVTMATIDTTKFSGGSLSAGSFNGGSGSFTQGADEYQTTTYDVTNEVLTITAGSFTQGTDSHTHTAATHTQGTLTPAALGTGFYTAGSVTDGTAASLGAGFYTAGTAPTMPTFDTISNIVTKNTTATAAAQTFSGSESTVSGTINLPPSIE